MRIIPHQCSIGTNPAWGFVFENNLMHWDSFEKAEVAARALGFLPHVVTRVSFLYAKDIINENKGSGQVHS